MMTTQFTCGKHNKKRVEKLTRTPKLGGEFCVAHPALRDKPAVSPTSKSAAHHPHAAHENSQPAQVWKLAIQQAWKPALRPNPEFHFGVRD